MTISNHHWDVGAYALGVLDVPDAEQFEEHLVACAACADDLDAMLPVTTLLSHVDVADFTGAEAKPERGLGGLSLQTRITVPSHERVSAKPRRVPVMVAGLILVAMMAVSYVAGTKWGAPADAVVARPPQAVSTGQPYESTQADVRTRVTLTSARWGTGLALSLSGVRGPLACELLVIDETGRSTVAISWVVPEPGYGTPEQPEALNLQGATAVSRDTIIRIEIRATNPAGVSTTLAALDV